MMDEFEPDDEATAEARRIQDEWIKAHPPFGDQDENGIDLSLIRENLKLTVEQRIRKAQNAANALLAFKNAINRI